MQLNLLHLLDLARSALADAETLFHETPGEIRFKGDRDMVSETDVAIEKRIRAALRAQTPSFGFECEETGVDHADATTRWILDPVDGTANYIRDLPLCGISLALVHEQTPVLGVTTLPTLQRRYWAAAGLGAWRDGKRIQASRAAALSEAMVAVGDYTLGRGDEERDRVLRALVPQLAKRAQRTRMIGTSAMDLVLVADGGFDGSVTLANRDWDMAAGVVIAREAGVRVDRRRRQGAHHRVAGQDRGRSRRARGTTDPGLRSSSRQSVRRGAGVVVHDGVTLMRHGCGRVIHPGDDTAHPSDPTRAVDCRTSLPAGRQVR